MAERLFLRLAEDRSHGPESSAPEGTLRAFSIAPELRQSVSQVLLYRESLPPDVTVCERVLPDGLVRLVFNLGDAHPRERALAIGASAAPALVQNRLAFGMAEELRPHGVASVAVSPGWMRTEFILTGHKTDEAHWHERPELSRTESPRYLGRAVAHLAGDPEVMKKSGKVLRVADLAREYGFTDIDGRQVEAFEL